MGIAIKVLGVVRDTIVIVGVAFLCWLGIQDRLDQQRDRAARFAATRAAITHLETAYKEAVYHSSENKGIYQQIFRQNEILLEYVKLAILRDVLPTNDFNPDAPPKLATP